MKMTFQQYNKYKEYLKNLKIKITTNEGIVIIDEPFRKNWLDKSTALRVYLENKIRGKFKLISALEKLREPNEKHTE
jgi:hypothetical protein